MDVHVNLPTEADNIPNVNWIAAWGGDVREGDLVRVVKLGGPVKIISLKRFYTQQRERPGLTAEDDGRWFFGAVVEDREGQQFHLFIQPHEAIFLAVEVPAAVGEPEPS